MTTSPDRAGSAAKDVFSYLLMIGTLYVSVVSFLTLIFQYINISFPDVLSFSYEAATGTMRSSISALLIVWPVFLLLSWMIEKDIQKMIVKKDLWIRKWLLYLTLFIAAIAIIVDLVTLTNIFLSGEITTRFILKVVSVLVVAVAVFTFYLWDLRRDTTTQTKHKRFTAIGTSVVILLSIVCGFVLVGSPVQQRAIRFDLQRTTDLQTLQWQILNDWTTKGKLPTHLTDLNDSISGFVAPTDPVTHQPYGYNIKGDLSFELCATFVTDSAKTPGAKIPSYLATPASPYGVPDLPSSWDHKAGFVCFERTIDPARYPKTPKQPLN